MSNFDWINGIPHEKWTESDGRYTVRFDYADFMAESGVESLEDLKPDFDEWSKAQPKRIYLTSLAENDVPLIISLHYLKA